MSIKEIIRQLKIILAQLRVFLLNAKITIPNLKKPIAIVVHWDGTGNSFILVDDWHRQKWGFLSSLKSYCGYHYFISKNGQVHQARADNEEGAHCVEIGNPHYWNTHSIGICLQSKQSITQPQKNSLEVLLKRLQAKYNISYNKIYGHRNISNTICPGDEIYQWLLSYKGRDF